MKQLNSSQRSKENNSGINFDLIKKENYEDTFPRAERWIRSVDANLLTNKKERKISIMKNYFATHKLKLAYTFLILAFVVAACNYPVTQHETIGDVLSWEIPADNSDAVNQIEAIELLKTGDYTSDKRGVNGKAILYYNLVLKDISPEKIAEFKSQLQNIAGVTNINSVPINETVTRPVYSAALNEIFKININATNKSDEELRKEITEQLKKAGIENMQIDFEKDSKGNRRVKFFRPLSTDPYNDGFDMTIKDGNNVNRMKQVRRNGENNESNFKGKSDSEIRKMVKEDFGDANLQDDQIEITREGDNVKIRVKVDKGGGNREEKLDIQKEVK